MCVCVCGGGGGRKRSISIGQDERLAPEGFRGSGVCLGVTDNDVFLCFFQYSDSHLRPDTWVKVYAWVGVWKCDSCNNPKQLNILAQHKRTKGAAVEFQWSFSVLIRLLCTALYNLLQHNLYSHFPSLIYRTFKVLLAACGWGWGGHSFKWK